MSDIRSQVIMFTQQLPYLKCSKKELIMKVKHLPYLTQFALIVHDKDVKPDNSPIVPHLHLVICFSKRVRIAQVSKRLEQSQQYFESMTKRGKSLNVSRNNALAYLVHQTTQAKEQGKYQYDPLKVVANFNYKNYISKLQQLQTSSPKQILSDFNLNKITKLEALRCLKESNSPNLPQYITTINKIDEINNKIKQDKWIKNHEHNQIPIKVIWIFGESGSGKTNLAKHIAKKVSPNNNYDFTGTSRDAFQDIKMQPVLIIDEIRPQDIKFNDLLKLLDNYNFRKNAPSRYHDKHIIADTIIITSPLSPIEFYEQYNLSQSDSFYQLARRLNITIKLTPTTISELKLTKASLSNKKIKPTTQVIPTSNQHFLYYKETKVIKNNYNNKDTQTHQIISLSDLL